MPDHLHVFMCANKSKISSLEALMMLTQGDPKKTSSNSNYSKYTGPVFLGHPVQENLILICKNIDVNPISNETKISLILVCFGQISITKCLINRFH